MIAMLRKEQCLLVKNEVFNEIANLAWGSSVLVLDETHFESILFLDSLLKGALADNVRLVTTRLVESSLAVTRLNLEQMASLNELSITIAQIRDTLGTHGVIVHHYLPHLLVRESEDEVLRMLEFWAMRTTGSELIEFYTLPHGTFPAVEKKAASLFSGEIVIRFSESGKNQLVFQIKKICKPQYHLAEFPFMTKDDSFLIKWGDTFTDQIPKEEIEQIGRITEYLRNKLGSVKMIAGDYAVNASTYELWLLSQVHDKRLTEIALLFPDVFDEILGTLARLKLRGMLSFEEVKEIETPPPRDLGLMSKIALRMPTWLSKLFLYKKARYITMDAFLALRNAVESFAAYGGPEVSRGIAELERFYQEMSSRKTAVQTIKRNKEDPRAAFDLKYFNKVVGLALNAGLQISPEISRVSPGVYEISLKECPICRDIRSDEPFCGLIEQLVRGVCGVTFKRKVTCKETKCVAVGDSRCVFLATVE